MTPDSKLKKLTRRAILASPGDIEKARETLNELIMRENDASLERELCAAYRNVALRATLATQYQELRSEGQLSELRKANPTPIKTTDYDQTIERPKTWAEQRVEKIEERKKSRLDTFHVNGIPLRDCTATQCLDRAERNEHEARFLRRIANGIPSDGKVGDYITDDEADKVWTEAQDRPLFGAPTEGIWAKLWPWLTKGIKNEEQFEEAQRIANGLESSFSEDYEPARVALDGLARAIKDFEDNHRR